MEDKQTNKRNALVIGGVVGALIGVVAANIILKASEDELGESDLSITPAKGMKLGMLVLGLLRQLSDL